MLQMGYYIIDNDSCIMKWAEKKNTNLRINFPKMQNKTNFFLLSYPSRIFKLQISTKPHTENFMAT